MLERNRLIVLSARTSVGSANNLDNFFPFDPFLLKISSKFFKNSYNFWVSDMDDEEEEYDDEDESSGSIGGTPIPIGGPLFSLFDFILILSSAYSQKEAKFSDGHC